MIQMLFFYGFSFLTGRSTTLATVKCPLIKFITLNQVSLEIIIQNDIKKKAEFYSSNRFFSPPY